MFNKYKLGGLALGFIQASHYTREVSSVHFISHTSPLYEQDPKWLRFFVGCFHHKSRPVSSLQHVYHHFGIIRTPHWKWQHDASC